MSGPRLSLTGIKKETHVIYFGNSVVNYFIHYNDKLLEEGTIKSVSQKLFNIISGANLIFFYLIFYNYQAIYNIEIPTLLKWKNIEHLGYGSVWDRHQRYIVIFLASKLFNFAPSLLFLRISDNFSTGPEYVMRTSTRARGAQTPPLLLAASLISS